MEKTKYEQGNLNSNSRLIRKTSNLLDLKSNENFNKQHPGHNYSGLINVKPIADGNNTVNDSNQTSELMMAETISDNIEAATTYTCSMHPEVKSDKPGKCPKCGMELIEKR